LRLTGVYFDLTDRFKPEPAPRRRSVGGQAAESGNGGPQVTGDSESPARACVVLISVAKRLVPSAVRRNTVKRIVREAWRAALRDAVPRDFDIGRSAQGKSSGSARQTEQSGQSAQGVQDLRRPVAANGKASCTVCLVRLKRYPGADVKSGPGSRRASSKAAAASPGTSKAAPIAGAAAIRRSLRSDADRLFAAFLSHPVRAPEAAAPSVPRGGGPPAAT
jgi:hypothetical protein